MTVLQSTMSLLPGCLIEITSGLRVLVNLKISLIRMKRILRILILKALMANSPSMCFQSIITTSGRTKSIFFLLILQIQSQKVNIFRYPTIINGFTHLMEIIITEIILVSGFTRFLILLMATYRHLHPLNTPLYQQGWQSSL